MTSKEEPTDNVASKSPEQSENYIQGWLSTIHNWFDESKAESTQRTATATSDKPSSGELLKSGVDFDSVYSSLSTFGDKLPAAAEKPRPPRDVSDFVKDRVVSWVGETWDKYFAVKSDEQTDLGVIKDKETREKSSVEIDREHHSVSHKAADGSVCVVDSAHIKERDANGNTLDVNKKTNEASLTNEKGTLSLERKENGLSLFTEKDDRGGVLRQLEWDRKSQTLTTISTDGTRTQINDQAVVTQFKRDLISIVQHARTEAKTDIDKPGTVHTMPDGSTRINNTDGSWLVVHNNGDREMHTVNARGKDLVYLMRKDSKTVDVFGPDDNLKTDQPLATIREGEEDNAWGVKFNSKRDGRGSSFNFKGTSIASDGQVTTNDGVLVNAGGDQVTVTNANGDGKDVIVRRGPKGASVVQRPDGSCTVMDPESGTVLETRQKRDGTQEVIGEHRLHEGLFGIKTTDGDMSFSKEGVIAWNGDRFNADGTIDRSNGTKIDKYNGIEFKDGLHIDMNGFVFLDDEVFGCASFEEENTTTSEQTLSGQLAAAYSEASAVMSKVLSGTATFDDVKKLEAVIGNLMASGAACMAQGDFAGRAAAELAAATVGASLSQAQYECAIRNLSRMMVGFDDAGWTKRLFETPGAVNLIANLKNMSLHGKSISTSSSGSEN